MPSGTLAADPLASAPLLGSESSGSTVYYHPGATITSGGWTPSTGASLGACIDETTADLADYITSPDLSTPCTLAFVDDFGAAQSLPAGTWDIPFIADRTGTSGQIRIILKDSGGTTLATGAWHTLTDTQDTYTDTLTIASAADRITFELQA